ncbi:MAG: alpha-glucosidase/alpha-galactosidase, partial [Chloroflexota bacterium]|nr:alpha-glucosidase/alpha-galactosidase [Chloroflexota bacterium]
AERYAAELGANLRFAATSERDVALRGADFVLNTVQPLGHEAEEAWRRVAEGHGYYRGLRYSDSARSLQTNLHQYDFMLGLARDIERLCPNAWLIDSANPVFEGCTLMTRQTAVKVIGLCHGFHGYRRVAAFLGVPPDAIDQVEWEAPGVNHWIYLTHFRHRGQDLYPRLDEWIKTEAPQYWASFNGPYGEFHLARAVVDHYQRVGLLPIGDAARTFDQWYYHADLPTKRRWYGHLGGRDSEISWRQYLERLDGNIQRIEQVATDESVPVTTLVKPERTREVQVPIIDAIANDRPGVFQVNVPNSGAIQNIAADVVVEGKALVDASGAKLLHVGKLLQMVLRPRIAATEKGLLAYQTGDRDLLVSAVLDDHRTRSLEQAEGVVDAMLALPWNGPLAERFGRRRSVLPTYPPGPA